MKCMMCGKELGWGGLSDIFYGDDPLCISCRRQWVRKKISFRFEGYRLRSSYVYNEAFSACLIQFKELGDEALKDAFLFEEKNRIRQLYHGYTAVLMPSSAEKVQSRGFSHLEKMFECTGLPVLDPFVKLDSGAQKGRNRYERMAMEDALRLKPDIVLPEKIVLCDDTVTTGATLKGALRALGGYQGKITIYTVSANRRWL